MSQKLTYPLPDVYIWNYPIFHSDFWGMSEKGVASVSHYTSNGRSGRIGHTAVVAVPQSSRLGEDCGFPCWSHNQAQSLSHTPRSHLSLLFPTICSERDDLTVVRSQNSTLSVGTSLVFRSLTFMWRFDCLHLRCGPEARETRRSVTWVCPWGHSFQASPLKGGGRGGGLWAICWCRQIASLPCIFYFFILILILFKLYLWPGKCSSNVTPWIWHFCSMIWHPSDNAMFMFHKPKQGNYTELI